MSIETFVWAIWSLAAAALVLAGAAIALAYRGASRKAWIAHGALSVGVAAAMAAAGHLAIYRAFLPWWRTGAGYFATFAVPLIAAGWVARWSARRWPARPRWQAGVAVALVLLVAGLLGTRVGVAVFPQYAIIQAVQ